MIQQTSLVSTSVFSHAEDVKSWVEATGDENRDDHHHFKVVRDGEHGGESQQHGGGVQQPDGHVVTERHDVSPLPVGMNQYFSIKLRQICNNSPCISSPLPSFRVSSGSS